MNSQLKSFYIVFLTSCTLAISVTNLALFFGYDIQDFQQLFQHTDKEQIQQERLIFRKIEQQVDSIFFLKENRKIIESSLLGDNEARFSIAYRDDLYYLRPRKGRRTYALFGQTQYKVTKAVSLSPADLKNGTRWRGEVTATLPVYREIDIRKWQYSKWRDSDFGIKFQVLLDANGKVKVESFEKIGEELLSIKRVFAMDSSKGSFL